MASSISNTEKRHHHPPRDGVTLVQIGLWLAAIAVLIYLGWAMASLASLPWRSTGLLIGAAAIGAAIAWVVRGERQRSGHATPLRQRPEPKHHIDTRA
jgi:small-conductance mechanosensitive channel